MKESFMFEQNLVNINNGSFGSCPKQVAKAKVEYFNLIEQNSDKFLRYECEPLLKERRKLVA